MAFKVALQVAFLVLSRAEWDNPPMSGLRNSARCTLFALCVAVLQLLLPLTAYAQMAANGTLTQEICSSSPAKVFGGDGAAGDTVADHGAGGHSCCMCSLQPFLAPQPAPAPALVPQRAGVMRVGQTRLQYRAAVQVPPATGPPSRA